MTDNTAPLEAPYGGFEELAVEHMASLITAVEEWNLELRDEGIDTLDLIRAAKAIAARAEGWLDR